MEENEKQTWHSLIQLATPLTVLIVIYAVLIIFFSWKESIEAAKGYIIFLGVLISITVGTTFILIIVYLWKTPKKKEYDEIKLINSKLMKERDELNRKITDDIRHKDLTEQIKSKEVKLNEIKQEIKKYDELYPEFRTMLNALETMNKFQSNTNDKLDLILKKLG